MAPGTSKLNHLPPHLREVCSTLAVGLLRLRGHAEENIATDTGGSVESSLHFVAHQSSHAKPKHRRQA